MACTSSAGTKPFCRPGIEREGTWNYGQQYIAWHLVETKSALEGAPNELSLYATESYWTGTSSALRRYTLRLDGFVSVHAPMNGGELVTKPITFTGSQLALNFASSAAGGVRVEIQDAAGKPFPVSLWLMPNRNLATRSTAPCAGRTGRMSAPSPAGRCACGWNCGMPISIPFVSPNPKPRQHHETTPAPAPAFVRRRPAGG